MNGCQCRSGGRMACRPAPDHGRPSSCAKGHAALGARRRAGRGRGGPGQSPRCWVRCCATSSAGERRHGEGNHEDVGRRHGPWAWSPVSQAERRRRPQGSRDEVQRRDVQGAAAPTFGSSCGVQLPLPAGERHGVARSAPNTEAPLTGAGLAPLEPTAALSRGDPRDAEADELLRS